LPATSDLVLSKTTVAAAKIINTMYVETTLIKTMNGTRESIFESGDHTLIRLSEATIFVSLN
jgi:hypothetical protein